MWFGVTYEPTLAVGDTRDYISRPGYYGVGVEWRSFRDNRLALSLSASWQVIYETTDDILQVNNTTISGTQVRYIDFIPLAAGANYHFLSRNNRIRPFMGLAAGAYWVKQRFEIGSVDFILNKNWHFGLAPEVGITFLTPDMEFYGFLSSKFNYIFARENSIDYTYVTLRLGIVYLL
jgi:hypothetical protein